MHETEPLNRHATRTDIREAERTSVTAGHFVVPTDEEVQDLVAYLASLRPEPSPHLAPDGSLTASAERGKGLYRGRARCDGCHPAPYYTDQRMHNVGVLSENEPDGRYDTPSLIEAHRTAPYLHDGRAATMKDVLTVHNHHDRHGHTCDLTEQEIDDLVAYLMSL